jgi:hypothetical protein
MEITIGGGELIPQILAAERAMVFISVTWSAPERNARREFEEAAGRWKVEFPDHAIEFFRLNIDEELFAQDWLIGLGFGVFIPMGAGSLLWLEKGKVVDNAPVVNVLGKSGIIERTNQRWGFR